ncbi:MAG: hypothetical protein JWP08_4337, partial [Bryobacterales bacterium]|nr:hypothetical protein [Bryobacterales bacterium]
IVWAASTMDALAGMEIGVRGHDVPNGLAIVNPFEVLQLTF